MQQKQSYIKLLNTFHDQYADRVSPSAGWLYVRLLHEFNRNYWNDLTTSISAIARLMRWQRGTLRFYIMELYNIGLINIISPQSGGKSSLMISLSNRSKYDQSTDQKLTSNRSKYDQSTDQKLTSNRSKYDQSTDHILTNPHIIYNNKDYKDIKTPPIAPPKGGLERETPDETIYDELRKFVETLPASVIASIGSDRPTITASAGSIVAEWESAGYKKRSVGATKRHLINQIRCRIAGMLASGTKANFEQQIESYLNGID